MIGRGLVVVGSDEAPTSDVSSELCWLGPELAVHSVFSMPALAFAAGVVQRASITTNKAAAGNV